MGDNAGRVLILSTGRIGRHLHYSNYSDSRQMYTSRQQDMALRDHLIPSDGF